LLDDTAYSSALPPKALRNATRFGLVVERGAGAVGTGSTTKRLVFQTRRKYSAAENADD